jgi:hypothetical protein
MLIRPEDLPFPKGIECPESWQSSSVPGVSGNQCSTQSLRTHDNEWIGIPGARLGEQGLIREVR